MECPSVDGLHAALEPEPMPVAATAVAVVGPRRRLGPEGERRSPLQSVRAYFQSIGAERETRKPAEHPKAGRGIRCRQRREFRPNTSDRVARVPRYLLPSGGPPARNHLAPHPCIRVTRPSAGGAYVAAPFVAMYAPIVVSATRPRATKKAHRMQSAAWYPPHRQKAHTCRRLPSSRMRHPPWVFLSKANPEQRHMPPTASTPAPQLSTYFGTFKTDHLGQILMSGILNIEAFSKVDMEVIQWPQAPVNMTVLCNMGKISGQTLAQNVAHFPLGTAAQIHTFDVVGPEFIVVLTGGPPDTDVPLQAWVFLH